MKTTKADFEYFVERCCYWQDQLGLTTYMLTILHEQVEDSRAGFRAGYKGMKATVMLSPEWKLKPTRAMLNRSALHEMLHVAHHKLDALAEDRIFDPPEYESETHALFHRLFGVILGENSECG